MIWPLVRVGDVAEQIRGVTFGKSEASAAPAPGLIPVFTATNVTEQGLALESVLHIPKARVSPRQMLRKNDLVVTASSGSLSVVGRAALVRDPLDATFGAFCKVLRPSGVVDPNYFAHFLRTPKYRSRVAELAAGANINNLRNEDLDNLEFPLPSLAEQRRVASVLDMVDSERQRRLEALRALADARTSLFDSAFGDPIRVLGWDVHQLGSLAIKYSDGPFGSNLKGVHYTTSGVRVVRLQNIGVGEFIDADRAFISEEHFRTIAKHECAPGDVLIGTLGDPNLRACIQPSFVERAVNKADCIQFRPNPELVTAEYMVGFLNHPSTSLAASGLVLGQTRGRISLGRLRGFPVSVPPLHAQVAYSADVRAHELIRSRHLLHLAKLDELFASLQHRAFRGEL